MSPLDFLALTAIEPDLQLSRWGEGLPGLADAFHYHLYR